VRGAHPSTAPPPFGSHVRHWMQALIKLYPQVGDLEVKLRAATQEKQAALQVRGPQQGSPGPKALPLHLGTCLQGRMAFIRLLPPETARRQPLYPAVSPGQPPPHRRTKRTWIAS
jgi:hypothetical protein